MKQYETVIGLEVHVELDNKKQKFSADAPLNSEEHPIHIHARSAQVCPGSLPVLK